MNNEEIKKKALKLINERHGALGFEPMILTLDIDEVTYLMTEFATQLLSQPTQGETPPLPKAECEGDWNSCKHIKTCGHHPCNLDECPEFEPDLQIANREPQTPAELRAEFSREAEINIPMVIEMNIRNSGRNVLHKYIEWLEQKLTGKE